jgi:hypothetical protein
MRRRSVCIAVGNSRGSFSIWSVLGTDRGRAPVRGRPAYRANGLVVLRTAQGRGRFLCYA